MSRTIKPLIPADLSLPADLESCFAALELGTDRSSTTHLPFCGADVTAGSESELQAVVIGSKDQVDLPQEIETSRFFANLQRRTQSGEAPEHSVSALTEFLAANKQMVWENSWVRFPRRCLSRYAEQVFQLDLCADKQNPQAGQRSDAERFQLQGDNGEPLLRVPVSYLLKLALADLIGNQALPAALQAIGEDLLEHFLSDNTSPETFSFHVEKLTPQNGMGQALAKETAKRFLFTQLLVHYANVNFGLLESGQQALIYFAPHPPLRQKALNEMVPDAFYRQLFMSPCLSGWNQGEGKHSYMELCHQVLSRSQLNAVAKLREAGIITNNLVVLPNVSNTSLSNNGVHISLGSQKLTRACQSMNGFGPAQEKFVGDLACKIMEHFLPLFAITYSAAPYRLDFSDFHPEKALGFLPHQLDFTHLRMLWRRWKKKASLSFFGHSLTPFGPPRFDRLLSRSFSMHGDLVPDFRLLDYPVCFLSTDQSPAYNGRLGNQDQLKEDLADMGVFDRQMSLYQFFKLREFNTMGFSGFEGRHYSLFPDFERDMAAATNLQVLITALAFRYMAQGQVRHRFIPDTPFAESERRQIFFAKAIGIPTFYVLKNTRNRFLLRILKCTGRIRASRRYPGYLRVYHQDYCKGLIALLRQDAGDLIEEFGFSELINDLWLRLDQPAEYAASGRLIAGITGDNSKNPLKRDAREFNQEAERYYRQDLRKQHLQQAYAIMQQDLAQMDRTGSVADQHCRDMLRELMQEKSVQAFTTAVQADAFDDRLGRQPLNRLLKLLLLIEYRDRQPQDGSYCSQQDTYGIDSSIYRPDQRACL